MIFDDILKRVHIDENSTVILAGMSAGGVAALYWADYLQALLPAGVKYGVIADSGFGVDVVNYHTKTNVLRNWS